MSQKPIRPLWRCPKCGARFVTKNMWHSCGKFSLEKLFSRSEPHVLTTFRKFARMVQSCGPAKMIPQKTRVVFMVRVRFGGASPRKSYFLCSLAFPRRVNHPRFIKIKSYGPYFYSHVFRVESKADLDAEVRGWIREAYKVGEQEYLQR